MTRPQIIRADSIDLQDHDAPSAQEHKHASDAQALGSHQAETLREVAAETKEERRLSWASGDIGDLSQYAEDINGAGYDVMQEDRLAIAQNGGATGSDDGDMDDGDEDLDDDMMDKISSSPSIEDEDIDFEFVYALHTFVATVEGQANATKGDTMVLLDDSNSYWWLVRVVKDSSIGYLPAEHIETPTERLARLNKHRNIDLASTMLGDTADPKIKTTIKSAIRRRKKTVTFSSPTIFNYSDHDYSSDEADDNLFAPRKSVKKQADQQQEQAGSQMNLADEPEDESARVEPLKPRSQLRQVRMDSTSTDEESDEEDGPVERDSDEFFDGRNETSRTTRNGTVRNTDSFFRDDTVETKKITLTPNLLRDDNEPRASSDSKEVRQRPSLDKLEKELVPDKKEDKKKKEKKSSAIRSFFSRKDRKKSVDEDDESFGKRSMDTTASSVDGADEEQGADIESSPEQITSPQRSGSRLEKLQIKNDPSPTRTNDVTSPNQQQPTRSLSNSASNASVRMVESEPLDPGPGSAEPKPLATKTPQPLEKAKSSVSKILHSSSEMLHSSSEVRPQKLSKAKSRLELDDFDSSEEEEEAATQLTQPTPASRELARKPSDEKQLRPSLPGAYPDSYINSRTATPQQSAPNTNNTGHITSVDRMTESPVPHSLPSNHPPPLVGDTSSQEDRSSTLSSPSPELADAESRGHHNQDSMTTASTAATNTAWNDANLRAFFDSSSDIRDMLVVVYDKTDVQPAGLDHPVVGPMFKEQNAKLAEITTQLDNMLGDWLARKQRLRGGA